MTYGVLMKMLPYFIAFAGALALTLILTPLVRELNRHMGMVDNPDERRINKIPIPRGGGIAIVLGVFVSYSVFVLITGRPPLQGDDVLPSTFWKMMVLSFVISALGYADDKFSLKPIVKLSGQIVVAVFVWAWVGLGFHRLWPSIPEVLDLILTVFWIVGAVNAFNLIDGLDGLASGLALIATVGMAGSLFIIENPQATLFYFALAGGLLAFLRYNYNPATVFLGDSGSMFLGFVISTLPLVSQTPNSFLVSVGVPLLAMGVPIFDTALAILRRSLRHLILRRGDAGSAGNDKVMTADADHLHHRILRALQFNQRKAAWTLYVIAAVAVAFGLVGMSLQSHTAGLWLVAVTFATFVIFKNMARIELFDAGRLLNSVARDRNIGLRRRIARLAVPISVAYDVCALVLVYLSLLWVEDIHAPMLRLRVGILVRSFCLFAALVFFNVYRTVWSRAMLSNYMRLFFACVLGSAVGGAIVYFAAPVQDDRGIAFSVTYALTAFTALVFGRVIRHAIRDTFYAIDCSRLKGRKDVSRILVYGSGLRYRAFRRELVRTTSANDRMIVGLLDDDLLLRGQYIGGIQILGPLVQAPEIINRYNVDSVVIACDISDEWMKIVRETLDPTGVKITYFTFSEKEIK